MSAAAQTLRGTTVLPAVDGERWLGYLHEHTAPGWRSTEWDPTRLLFTGDVTNPATTVYRCLTLGCVTLSVVKVGHCVRCRSALAKDRQPGPTPASTELLCGQGGVPGCALPTSSKGLCRDHSGRFHQARKHRSKITVTAWDVTQTPHPSAGPCGVGWCDRTRPTPRTSLCKHHQRDHRSRPGLSEAQYRLTARPPLAASEFSLADCPPVLAAEIIYGLQRRDAHEMAVAPFAMRDLIALIQPHPSLAQVNRTALHSKAAQMLDNLKPYVDELHDQFTGRDVFGPDRWGPQVMMRFPGAEHSRYTVRFSVDWSVIACPWLKDIGKLWARDTLPRKQSITTAVKALQRVSAALLGSAGFHDRQALALADVTAIVRHITTMKGDRGQPLSYSKSTAHIGIFRVILAHARDSGYLPDVPSTFAFTRIHALKKPRPDLEEPGRAIPDPVIELLNEHLASFTPDYRSSHRLTGWSNEDYGLMWQTIYRLIRDTGRRPGEITSLRFDCVTSGADGEPILVWDNHKAGRLGRRLPVFTSTAETVRRWQEHLHRLSPGVTADLPLFPAASARGPRLTRATQASYYGQKFRTWVSTVPGLGKLLADLTTAGTPFGLDEIVLYGLRHAYAQSLADAGIHPDVLMQLMDHRSMETTSGYYRIGQKRKRDAIAVMSKLRSDIYGATRPVTDLETYKRTEVATILGGCSEPANVKAGGKACPIRFQCGACSFYRPDPTYVPEIEDEIRRLRKDIAAAELCSTRPVVENLQYNLAMMQAVLRKMHDNLTALTAEEQAIYEVFHAAARKSRNVLRLDLTVIQPSGLR